MGYLALFGSVTVSETVEDGKADFLRRGVDT